MLKGYIPMRSNPCMEKVTRTVLKWQCSGCSYCYELWPVAFAFAVKWIMTCCVCNPKPSVSSCQGIFIHFLFCSFIFRLFIIKRILVSHLSGRGIYIFVFCSTIHSTHHTYCKNTPLKSPWAKKVCTGYRWHNWAQVEHREEIIAVLNLHKSPHFAHFCHHCCRKLEFIGPDSIQPLMYPMGNKIKNLW